MKHKSISKACSFLVVLVLMLSMCSFAFASVDSGVDIAPATESVQTIDDNGSDANALPAEDADAAQQEERVDETAPNDAAEVTGEDGASEDAPEADTVTTPDDDGAAAAAAAAHSRNRYLVCGGIVLAIGIGFYAFLCIKTNKNKKK